MVIIGLSKIIKKLQKIYRNPLVIQKPYYKSIKIDIILIDNNS